MDAELFETYLAEQAGLGRSPYTIEKARWAWRKWQEYTTTPLMDLAEDDLHRWHTWLFRQGLGRNTVSTHARVMRAFLRWCRKRGYVSFEAPPAPSPAKPNRRTLNNQQLMAFMAALEHGSRNRLRNRAIFLLFVATGMRLGELGRLTLEDVDHQAQAVIVRPETSKSRKRRMIPMGAVATQALHDYILWGRQGSTEPALFLNEQGGPLGLRGIHLIIQRAARKAGVPWATPHVLRHTFATQSLLGGLDAFHVKALLGHASIRSTEIYLDMAEIERSLQGGATPADRLLRGAFLQQIEVRDPLPGPGPGEAADACGL